MDKISENLDRFFKSLPNETNLKNFFISLGDYTNYILETPELKIIVEREMKKKLAEYKKEWLLEKEALQELATAKRKLLKIIKDEKISPDALCGEWSGRWSGFLLKGENILNKLEEFEKGKITSSLPRSNALEHYLFEIAVGISKQNQRLLNEFDDPQRYSGNIFGNFTFSQTLKKRERQTKNILVAKEFELWGCLDHLLKFQKAFSEASKNSHYLEVYQKYNDPSPSQLERGDLAYITHFAEELKKIMAGEILSAPSYADDIEKFKDFATRVNNRLLTELSKRTDSVNKNDLKSIHLITDSLEPKSVIFLVLDERFEMPIRFAVKNKNGDPTYIKKLYDIAYVVDAPNKRVNYDKNIADGINNGLFKKGAVAKYMKTNKLNKPTLVQKSENKTLVLKNEILVKTGRDKNDVPIQYQSIYIDKTK